MSIEFACKCGKRFKVRSELAGKRGKCDACGSVLVIPNPVAQVATGASGVVATPKVQAGAPSTGGKSQATPGAKPQAAGAAKAQSAPVARAQGPG